MHLSSSKGKAIKPKIYAISFVGKDIAQELEQPQRTPARKVPESGKWAGGDAILESLQPSIS